MLGSLEHCGAALARPVASMVPIASSLPMRTWSDGGAEASPAQAPAASVDVGTPQSSSRTHSASATPASASSSAAAGSGGP